MTNSHPVHHWAVVVPNFNHADDAIGCIGSIWSAQPRPGRILLVDDASTDGAVEKIAEWTRTCGVPLQVESGADATSPLPEGLTIIAADRNEGFTLTSNKGLGCALVRTNAPYVLLLNNDAEVAPDFFAQLAAAVHDHPQAGLMTGTIYEWDRSTVWYAGGRLNPLRALATHETKLAGHDTPRLTQWVSGCAMLISREVLLRVGTLATCFSPCYSEDVDYSLRAHAAGFELIIAPRAVAYHRVGASLGKPGRQRPDVTYFASRNRAYVVRRNYRGLKRLIGVAYLSVTKPLRAAAETLRGRPRIGWAILAGTVNGLLNRAATTSR